MASWFVRPDIATLPLSEGHTLTVRRRLNAGERRAAMKRIADPMDASLALVTAYLLDWSLTDVAIRETSVAELTAALDNLDPERFAEIVQVISAHVDAMAAAREQEKKVIPTIESGVANSPSPSDVAGGSSGSASSTSTTTTFS
jgi:hypothetical protein